MILTVKEKIELLEKVKINLFEDIYKNDVYHGLCYYISKNYKEVVANNQIIEIIIPELNKYKPSNARKYLYGLDKAGFSERIEVINKTIQDLENLLQEKEIEKIYFKCNPENILLEKSNTFNNVYHIPDDDSIALYVHKDFIKRNPDMFIVKYKEDIVNKFLNREIVT